MSEDVAVDLGTSRTRVLDDEGRVRVDEPTLAAVDSDSGKLVAFGSEAIGLVSSGAGRVRVVAPVRHGQLEDFELTRAVLAEVLRRAGASRLARPRALAGVSDGATALQRRALQRALRKAGARTVRLIEASVAAAVGSGLPIEQPAGSMVVVVGAGRCEIAVLALGGIVASVSLPIGGGDLDDAVRSYVAREHGVQLDRASAEGLRIEAGSFRSVSHMIDLEVDVIGRHVRTGRAVATRVTRLELCPVLSEAMEPVFVGAVACISSAPPDLANDLLGSGLNLAGGLAHADGLDQRLAFETGLPVHVDPAPELVVARGIRRCLTSFGLPASIR